MTSQSDRLLADSPTDPVNDTATSSAAEQSSDVGPADTSAEFNSDPDVIVLDSTDDDDEDADEIDEVDGEFDEDEDEDLDGDAEPAVIVGEVVVEEGYPADLATDSEDSETGVADSAVPMASESGSPVPAAESGSPVPAAESGSPVPAAESGSPVPAAESDASVPAGSAAPATPARATPAAGSGELSDQWHDIQAMFVDDPSGSVQRAADAAEAAVSALVESLQERQAALAPTGGPRDTEQLREALRSYRVFCRHLAEVGQQIAEPAPAAS